MIVVLKLRAIGALEAEFTVFLVSSASYADALSVSSAAALIQSPILYLNPDGSVPTETADALSRLGAKKAYIIGGDSAVDGAADARLSESGVKCSRIFGADRYQTSIAVYDSFNKVFTSEDFAIATGTNFPDALAGAAFASKKGTPIMLTGSNVSDDLVSRIRSSEAKNLYVFGGQAVIPENVVETLVQQ